MEKLLIELKKIVEKDNLYQYNFFLYEWQTDFLRFYKSQSNYNITQKRKKLEFTMVKDKRKFSSSISAPTVEKVYEKIEDAKKVIDFLPKDNDFENFEDNKDIFEYSNLENSIKEISLDKKINILKEVTKVTDKYDFEIYGTFISLYRKGYFLNSSGLEKMYFVSPVMLETKAVSKKNNVSVINSYGGNDLSNFSLEDYIKQLELKISGADLDIIDIEPGKYDVIISPQALAEFLSHYSFGFYGQVLDKGRSFFEGKMDKKVLPDKVSISSTPNAEGMITYPYNGDGHIARDTEFIKNGVFKNFVMDHYYSKKLNMEKNGSVGVAAIKMEKGDTSIEDMIRNTERGLYISNLHYMNFINMKETSVTGLTRDGTFLIENGKIKNVVNNLRFTEKINDIFKNIVGIENKLYTIPSSSNYGDFSISSSRVPHIKSKNFNISSSTHTI